MEQVAIPAGSSVTATVSNVQRPGRLKGRAEIRLRFDEVRLPDGTSLPLKASVTRAGLAQIDESKKGDPKLKGEAGSDGNIMVVAQGGIQGAILGTMAGHEGRRLRRSHRGRDRTRQHPASARSRPGLAARHAV